MVGEGLLHSTYIMINTEPLIATPQSHPEFFSFYLCDFMFDGDHCKSVEHALQAAKFLDEEVRQRILITEDPKEARNLGMKRHKSFRRDWNKVKVQIMADIQLAKYSSDDLLRQKLLETVHRPIKMMSSNDLFWSTNEEDDGSNILGRILCSVRWTLLMLRNYVESEHRMAKRSYYEKHKENKC